MSVFSNFLTNFNVQLPYLSLKTFAMESFDGNLNLVRKIDTKNIKNIITTYCIEKGLTALSNKPNS